MLVERTQLQRALSLPKPVSDQLFKRVGKACHAAHAAFAPFEAAARTGKHEHYAGFPDRIFDVEYFELAGIRIQRSLNGQCALSELITKCQFEEVEKYEQAARTYIEEMNALAVTLGLIRTH